MANDQWPMQIENCKMKSCVPSPFLHFAIFIFQWPFFNRLFSPRLLLPRLNLFFQRLDLPPKRCAIARRHAIKDQHAIEMIGFMLPDASRQFFAGE